MFGLLDRGGAAMEMTSLIVDPSMRRKGFAQELLEEAFRLAKWEGKNSLIYETLSGNRPIMKLVSSYDPQRVSDSSPVSRFFLLQGLVAFRLLRYRIDLKTEGKTEQALSRLWYRWSGNCADQS